MTSKWIIAVGLILIVLTLLALFSRKSVRAELTVDASPEEVWTVLTDTASYAEWNPILVSVDGEFAEGSILSVEMKNPDGSTSVLTPRVRQIAPGETLNQVGGVPGVLTFDHTWRLEAIDGRTRVTQFEVYRGIGVLFWDPSWVEESYRLANQKLRDRVESH